jgi:hypothetical protein
VVGHGALEVFREFVRRTVHHCWPFRWLAGGRGANLRAMMSVKEGSVHPERGEPSYRQGSVVGFRLVHADELRQLRFEDLIESSLHAFQESSAGHAQNGSITMFPSGSRDLADVYVKTWAARGHSIHVVKVSRWFQVNTELGRAQGGFAAAFR